MRTEEKAAVGVYGLAVMGANLALNLESHGFLTAVCNRSHERTAGFAEANPGKRILACADAETFCGSLERPRKILIMVKAGAPVDAVIGDLLPHLERGDILIDGGNSWYRDTAARAEKLEKAGIEYVGLGVSGGEEGALHGPSLMPGAKPAVWREISHLLESVAARAADGTPCCAPLGEPAAGHFVKMVHNGIEYADMQLIAESWSLLRRLTGENREREAEIFRGWNRTGLESYLIEITAAVLEKTDDKTGLPLVDEILDSAGQKGTGQWTGQTALELGVPACGIVESVFARNVSALKDERLFAAGILRPGETKKNLNLSEEDVHRALYASKICAYAQGFRLFRAADAAFGWKLDPVTIASLWRGGCIIRAKFLDSIMSSFRETPNPADLMLLPYFAKILNECASSWRKTVAAAVEAGIPVPAFASTLSYYDSYRSENLPANLIQAQRDFFGAHTYERIDAPRGTAFHTNWNA